MSIFSDFDPMRGYFAVHGIRKIDLLALSVVVLTSGGCGTLFHDKLAFTIPAAQIDDQFSCDAVFEAAAEVLRAHEFTLIKERDWSQEWRWRDPENATGLWVDVKRVGDELRIDMFQDLFGPIGPTTKIRDVREALAEAIIEQFGEESGER